MVLERISDGAFVTANKLDFCYTNWAPLRIICKLNKPTKSEDKVKIQNSKIKNQKLKVKKQKKDKS